jgi:hypothetical protein
MRLRQGARDETGASLILALIFIVVVSVIMLALTSLATNGLNNVAQFRTPQLERSAIGSAMNTAIYQQRHTVTPQSINATVLCSPVTIAEPDKSDTFQIWCSTSQNDASNTATRTVTFSACPSTSTLAICSAPLLVATVYFDDYSYPVSQILTPPNYCSATCGTAETIGSWVLESTQ